MISKQIHQGTIFLLSRFISLKEKKDDELFMYNIGTLTEIPALM